MSKSMTLSQISFFMRSIYLPPCLSLDGSDEPLVDGDGGVGGGGCVAVQIDKISDLRASLPKRTASL